MRERALVRSDSPHRLTADGLAALHARGVRRVRERALVRSDSPHRLTAADLAELLVLLEGGG